MRILLISILLLPACGRLGEVGRAPGFTPLEGSYEQLAMYSNLPVTAEPDSPSDAASLWTSGKSSLFGDGRAAHRGDILTVVIEIDDSAEMRNTSGRSRDGSENMAIGGLFGLPENLNGELPEGASMDAAVDTSSHSSYKGDGSVKRNEKLELRIAATVVEELPNGVLRLQGQQEVRVNYELRELLVSGYVRSEDISRQNEVTYDKIAGAQISYGGRGQISAAQQPRYGQQVTDLILPY